MVKNIILVDTNTHTLHREYICWNFSVARVVKWTHKFSGENCVTVLMGCLVCGGGSNAEDADGRAAKEYLLVWWWLLATGGVVVRDEFTLGVVFALGGLQNERVNTTKYLLLLIHCVTFTHCKKQWRRHSVNL